MPETTVQWKDDSEAIGAVLYQFEKVFREGKNPAVEEYLHGEGPARQKLLVELLHSDLELRLRAGQSIGAANYLPRFPELAQQPDMLAALLGTEVRVLKQLGKPLQAEAYENAYGQYLGSHVKDILEVASQAPKYVDALIGTVIGKRYKIIKPLGQGGMGTVYLAEQSEPVKRQVALKLISAGIDSRNYITRFEAERQALAVMDHPNIARVYDGGTTEQHQPYFVMELVHGISITQYCDQQKLHPTTRLELFVQICQAVQHAHQKGIIHRDLKPGNVLVTVVDGKPVPKVIDFGLAKATEQPLTDETIEERGAVGTPAYMSPEQADPENMDVDTRTDVYALGVILYELLTGHTPIDVKQFRRGALLEMLRMVREVDPPKPSTKLSSAEELPSIAANRAVEPKELLSWVRGDIDWIVMKALEKDRNRRYETANGFAADVMRYMSGEAVLAHPPSRWYRVKKFVRRNRVQVVAAGLVVGVLTSALAVSLLLLNRAVNAEELAGKRERDATTSLQQVTRGIVMLGTIFEDLNPENKEQSAKPVFEIIGDRLQKASLELEGSTVGSSSAVAELQHTLARCQIGLGNYQKGISLCVKSIETLTKEVGRKHPDTLKIMNTLGTAYLTAKENDKALTCLTETLELQREVLGDDHSDTLTTISNLGICNQQLSRYRLAVKIHEELYNLSLLKYKEGDRNLILYMTNLAESYRLAGYYEKAETLFTKSLDASIKTRGKTDEVTLATMNNLALLYNDSRQPQKAMPLVVAVLNERRIKYGTHHHRTITAMNNAALTYSSLRKHDDAISLTKEAHMICSNMYGHEHANTIHQLHNLALLLSNMNNIKDAHEHGLSAYNLSIKALGYDNELTLRCMSCYANILMKQGQHDKAVNIESMALQHKRRVLGNTHPYTLDGMRDLAIMLQTSKKYTDACTLLSEALQGYRIKHGNEHKITRGCLRFLAQFHRDAGNLPQARSFFMELAEIAKKSLGSADRETIEAETAVVQLSIAGERYLSAASGRIRFRIDPKNVGLTEGWHMATSDTDWRAFQIGTHWDTQGVSHTGWAWYRLTIDIPSDWPSNQFYLYCCGADDYAEFYVDGACIGILGDPECQYGAYSMIAPLKFSTKNSRNNTINIAVRVYNEYGFGGLHQPIYLASNVNRKDIYDKLTGLRKLELEQLINDKGSYHDDVVLKRHDITILSRLTGDTATANRMIQENGLSYKMAKMNKYEMNYMCVILALYPTACRQLASYQYQEAADNFRICLDIYQRFHPESWITFNIQSKLGDALLGLGKYAEAEPLLTKGYDGIKDSCTSNSRQGKDALSDAIKRLIKLYTETNRPYEADWWKRTANALDLSNMSWRMKHDIKNVGVTDRWSTQPTDESWKVIRIGKTWDAQGYTMNGGPVWYRLDLKIPQDWCPQDYYMTVEGIDDYGEIFVNGVTRGAVGFWNPDRFLNLEPIQVPLKGLRSGETIQIAVRVFNWHGTGGIYKRITLSQTPGDMPGIYRQKYSELVRSIDKEAASQKPNVQRLYEWRESASRLCEALKEDHKAESLLRSNIEAVKQGKCSDRYMGAALEALAENLARQTKWSEAETMFLECLSFQVKHAPKDLHTYSTNIRYGTLLLGQRKYTQAEPFLVQGYFGLKSHQSELPLPTMRISEALDCLIQLYTETNKPDEVKKWQAEKARLTADLEKSKK